MDSGTTVLAMRAWWFFGEKSVTEYYGNKSRITVFYTKHVQLRDVRGIIMLPRYRGEERWLKTDGLRRRGKVKRNLHLLPNIFAEIRKREETIRRRVGNNNPPDSSALFMTGVVFALQS